MAGDRGNEEGAESSFGSRRDDVEIKTPLGWSLKVSGRQLSVLIAVILGTLAILYMLRDHDMRAGSRADALTIRVTENTTASKELADSVNNLAWIMTRSDDERKKLRLEMPAGLRKQLLQQERGGGGT